MNNWSEYAQKYGTQARAAARRLALIDTDTKNRWLELAAERLRDRAETLISENVKDLEAAPGYGLNAAAIDRLKLTGPRIEAIVGPGRASQSAVRRRDPIDLGDGLQIARAQRAAFRRPCCVNQRSGDGRAGERSRAQPFDLFEHLGAPHGPGLARQ